jgi:hypothetical protein
MATADLQAAAERSAFAADCDGAPAASRPCPICGAPMSSAKGSACSDRCRAAKSRRVPSEILEAQLRSRDSEWVFPNSETKGPYSSHYVGKVWRTKARKAGPSDFRFRDLRHHGVAVALNAGFSGAIVQDLGRWTSEAPPRSAPPGSVPGGPGAPPRLPVRKRCEAAGTWRAQPWEAIPGAIRDNLPTSPAGCPIRHGLMPVGRPSACTDRRRAEKSRRRRANELTAIANGLAVTLRQLWACRSPGRQPLRLPRPCRRPHSSYRQLPGLASRSA